jgi:hypothetical protein
MSPLNVSKLKDKGDLAVLNRWADNIDFKLNLLNNQSTGTQRNAVSNASAITTVAQTVTSTQGQIGTIGNQSITAGYHPLSNPLSATGTTITVSAFTMRTTSKGDLAINSGSLSGLTAGVVYFVYYDDPDVVGGAVTFVAGTSRGIALQGANRFFVGSIQIPAAGSGSINVGFNDGGFGVAQLANTVVYTNEGTASSLGSVGGLGNEKDGSFADKVVFTAAPTSAIRFVNYTVPYPIGSPTSLTLYVNYGAISTGGAYLIQYSTNGGSTFTTLASGSASQSQTTVAHTFALPQDQSQIQVFAEATSPGGPGMELDIYEIWLLATY